jgi:hypothetical protein
MWNELLVDGMADVLMGSQISWSGNLPVKLRPLKKLIGGVSVSVGYVKIHTHNGKFLRQRTYVLTWNIINIDLLVEEGTNNTFVLLTCLSRIATRRRHDNSTNA